MHRYIGGLFAAKIKKNKPEAINTLILTSVNSQTQTNVGKT
jgi:hypothetical protein